MALADLAPDGQQVDVVLLDESPELRAVPAFRNSSVEKPHPGMLLFIDKDD